MRKGSQIRRLLLLFIVFFMIKGSKFEVLRIQPITIGQTVNISCNYTPPSSLRWSRHGRVISQDNITNTDFPGVTRFRIIGGEQAGEYVLQILKAKEEDLGEYLCETQTKSSISYSKVILRLADTPLSTTDSTSMTTVPKKEQISTELTKEEEDTANDKGVSFHETFYYGLLAAGLVLVLCLSVMCNTCINRRCNSRNKRNVSNDNSAKESTEAVSHRNNGPSASHNMDEYSSTYESINENEMLPNTSAELTAVVHSRSHQAKPPKTASSIIDNSYLEIIDDNSDLTPCVSAEMEAKPGNPETFHSEAKTKRMKETGFVESADEIHIKKITKGCEKNSQDSKGSSDSSSSDFEYTMDNEYLHPYVPLNQNDMEYLSSYCTTKTAEIHNSNDVFVNSLDKNTAIYDDDHGQIHSKSSLDTNDEDNLHSNSVSASCYDTSDNDHHEKNETLTTGYEYTDASSSKVT